MSEVTGYIMTAERDRPPGGEEGKFFLCLYTDAPPLFKKNSQNIGFTVFSTLDCCFYIKPKKRKLHRCNKTKKYVGSSNF